MSDRETPGDTLLAVRVVVSCDVCDGTGVRGLDFSTCHRCKGDGHYERSMAIAEFIAGTGASE